ncbi:HAD-IIA family hydrolase [Mycolicibacterium arseniciresistens]|uniref:HAD-IIA family hydrolase n=1 Tax=Mycolicibacterium arseniciresistens TaxID=3062257 RepID=A0ABT8UG16_9MYCO|nr:HAD-IIA family hydrolase [Mycolicibacterium arseniciresistens]MDO3636728.1 HAD-IIA family hydrolase [Mycolicibacterium arseniciresistens]
MTSIAAQHDCLLLDLDGTVFRGHEPTTGAVDTLAAIEARVLYVTNNASRAPGDVAAHLTELGFRATADDVVTSAQSAARLLADQLPPEAKVLIVGTEALADEVAGRGLRPVRRADDEPVAVVQGHNPQTGWSDLAEAALAIRAGALWVAANVDLTLPSERGLLPGNGSMVAALRAATAREPQVAGKPQPTLFSDALSRGSYATPLTVGDRLDTDIAGANAAKLPSLLVLSGVSTADDTLRAPADLRPGFIGADLRSLDRPAEELRVGPHPGWRVDVDTTAVTVSATGQDHGDDLSVLRALADAVWSAGIAGDSLTVDAGDDTAREALQHLSLL